MPLEVMIVPNLLFTLDAGRFRASLLEGLFSSDCLTGEGLDRDDVVDEIGETLVEVDVTTRSPSSSSSP